MLLIFVFFIGIYCALGIYHLFVFIGRRNEFENLIYSFLCFAFSFTTFFLRILPSLMIVNTNISFLLITQGIFIIGMLGVYIFPYIIFRLIKLKKYMIFALSISFLSDIIANFVLFFTGNKITAFSIFFPTISLLAIIYIPLVVYNIIKFN